MLLLEYKERLIALYNNFQQLCLKSKWRLLALNVSLSGLLMGNGNGCSSLMDLVLSVDGVAAMVRFLINNLCVLDQAEKLVHPESY